MKAIVTLSFLLLFTLVSSLSYAHLNDHDHGNYFLPGKQVKIKQLPETAPVPGLYITQPSSGSQQAEHLMYIEEDEQDDITKPGSASRYFIAFYYVFFSNNQDYIVTNRPFYNSFFYPASDKYITLRVLRI
jgi:hypothetical protein